MWIITQTICRISALRLLFVHQRGEYPDLFTGTAESCFIFCCWAGILQARPLHVSHRHSAWPNQPQLEMSLSLAQIITTGSQSPKNFYMHIWSSTPEPTGWIPGSACHPPGNKPFIWFKHVGEISSLGLDVTIILITNHFDKTEIILS